MSMLDLMEKKYPELAQTMVGLCFLQAAFPERLLDYLPGFAQFEKQAQAEEVVVKKDQHFVFNQSFQLAVHEKYNVLPWRSLLKINALFSRAYPWKKINSDDYLFIKDMLPHLQRLAFEYQLITHTEAVEISLRCMIADGLLTIGKYQESYAELENHHAGRNLTARQKKCVFDILGMSAWKLGSFALQKYWFEKSEKLTRQLYGKDSPQYAQASISLAAAYKQNGDYEAALALLFDVVQIAGREDFSLDQFTAGVVIYLHEELGSVYHAMGNYSDARELLVSAIKIGEKWLDDDWFSKAITYAYLGLVECSLKNLDEARTLLETSFALEKERYPENHVRIAGASVRLGMVYASLGNNKRAQELLEQGLAINQEIYGENHLWVAQSHRPLGDALLASGKLGDGIRHLEDARRIYAGSCGAYQQEIKEIDEKLSEAYQKQQASSLLSEQQKMEVKEAEDEKPQPQPQPQPQQIAVVENPRQKKKSSLANFFICGCAKRNKFAENHSSRSLESATAPQAQARKY